MLILLLLLLPLAGAILTFLMGSKSASLSRNIALGTSLVSFVIWLVAFNAFRAGDTAALSFHQSWIASYNLHFSFVVDGFALVLVGLVSVLIPLIILSTAKLTYDKANVFYALILSTAFALVGVFTAKDIFLFYFFFEVALVPVYFLALGWGGASAPKITFKMFVYTIFGSLFMLVAFVYLYSKGQTADMDALLNTVGVLPARSQNILFWAFMLAFAIKMPLFPFHTWQPDAYTESPTPATMLLSGLLSKMGVFGLIRIALPFAPASIAGYANVVIFFAVVGLIYGSIIAIKQDNIKRLVAYSSFAHMGLMAAGVMSGTLEGLQGAIYQMLAHGINAVGLFFIIKIIFERTGSRSLSSLGGMTQSAPALSIYFMIILLGSVALPLTNGFVGEFLLLKGVFDQNSLLGILAGLTIILGAAYMLRLFQKTMFGPTTENTVAIADVSGTESIVLFVISALVIVMGVFPNVLLKITEPSASALINYLAEF